MNNPIANISKFNSKPSIYKEVLELIYKNKEMKDPEREKWISLLTSLSSEKVVKKIYDYFIHEESEISKYESNTLEKAKEISDSEYRKRLQKQVLENKESNLRSENLSGSFDDLELEELEGEIEGM